jgi:hypothetical protein
MLARLSALLLIAAPLLESTSVWADTLVVPSEAHPTVQDAVGAALNGDEIAIAPGVYPGNVRIFGKSLVLRATEPGQVTALEGVPVLDDGGTPDDPADDALVPVAVVEVRAQSPLPGTPPTEVVLVGLTVQGGDSGVNVRPNAHVVLEACHVRANDDGVELEGRGEAERAIARATVRGCLIEENGDDGVDVDQRSELWIENSVVRNNHQDGIEIRLQDNFFTPGERIRNVIRGNRLEGNGEDGLQLIDYLADTPRAFRVERNVIAGNGAAGLGMMCGARTVETFEACPIAERVELVHNTFLQNDHGLAGGANLLGVSNVFVGHALGVEGVAGASLLAHTLFHANAADHAGSEPGLDLATTRFADPLLDADGMPGAGSPAVDAGPAWFEAAGEVLLDLDSCAYYGEAPDLGATEGVQTLRVPASGGALERRGRLRASTKRLDLGSSKNDVLAGLRFEAIGIPPGAEIVRARLALTTAKKGNKPASLRIEGEASGDAAPFGPAPRHLSARDATAASVDWAVPLWPAAGAPAATPDLSPLVQEIVDRPDWAAGNAVALFASGLGKRSVVAFGARGAAPPRLDVDYVASPPWCP